MIVESTLYIVSHFNVTDVSGQGIPFSDFVALVKNMIKANERPSVRLENESKNQLNIE